MDNLRRTLTCAGIGLRRCKGSRRAVLALAVILLFAYFDFSDILRLARDYDLTVSAWAASAYFTPYYAVCLYAALLGILFSDAPFSYGHSQFEVARSGRLTWILGKLVYVAAVSLILTLAVWLATWLVLLPKLSFSNEWGGVERTLSLSSGIPEGYRVRVYLPRFLSDFSPIGTAGLGFLMMWLTGVFIGTLFMFLNLSLGRLISFSVFGFFLFMCFAAVSIGILNFGDLINYINPFSFCNVFISSHFSKDPNMPPLWYCISVPVGLVAAFAAGSVLLFCKKDITMGKDDRQ